MTQSGSDNMGMLATPGSASNASSFGAGGPLDSPGRNDNGTGRETRSRGLHKDLLEIKKFTDPMLPIELDLSRFPQWTPEQEAALRDLIDKERALAVVQDAERERKRKAYDKRRVETALERGKRK